MDICSDDVGAGHDNPPRPSALRRSQLSVVRSRVSQHIANDAVRHASLRSARHTECSAGEGKYHVNNGGVALAQR